MAAPTIVGSSVNSTSVTGTTLTANIPASPTVGNTLVMIVGWYGAWTGAGTSAWVQRLFNTDTTTDMRMAVYTRPIVGGESAASLSGFGASADPRMACVVEVSGTKGYDVGIAVRTTDATTSWVQTVQNANSAEPLFLRACFTQTLGENTTTWTWSGSTTPVSDFWTALGGDYYGHMAVIAQTPGSATCPASTITRSTTTGSNNYSNACIALFPTSAAVVRVESVAAAAISASPSPSITFTPYYPVENDVVVVFPNSTTTATVADVTGYTNPLGSTVDVESDSHEISCAYKVVSAAEAADQDGTVTFTLTSWYGANETGNILGVVLRGVDPAAVVDSINSWTVDTNTSAHHLPALTGTNLSTGSLVISCITIDASTSPYAILPAGWSWLTSSVANHASALLVRNTMTTAGVDVADTAITGPATDEGAAITIALSKLGSVPHTGAVTRTVTATVSPGAGKGTNIGVTETITATITPALTLGHAYTGALTRAATATVSPAAKTNQNAGTTTAFTATTTPALQLGHPAGLSQTLTATVTPGAVRGKPATLTETVTATITAGAGAGANIGVTQSVTATISPTASVKTNWTADLTETVTATVTPAAVTDQDVTVTEAVTAAITTAAQRGWTAGTTIAALAQITPATTVGYALTGAITQSITAAITADAKTNQNIAATLAAAAVIDTTAQVTQTGEANIDVVAAATVLPAARTDLNAGVTQAGTAGIDAVLARGLQAQIIAATTASITPTASTGGAQSADVAESVNADIAIDARADLKAAITQAASAVIAPTARTDQRIATTITAAADIDASASTSTPGTAEITIDAAAGVEPTARVASQTAATAVVIATIGVTANVTKNTAITAPVTATISAAALVDAHAATALPVAAAITVDGTKHADLTTAVTAAATITMEAAVVSMGRLLEIADRYTVTIPATPEITIMADVIVIQVQTDTTAQVVVTDLGIPEIPVCLEVP